MEKKRIIPEGTRWGTLTYVKDLFTTNKSRRPILVQCDCGAKRQFELSSLENKKIGSCKTIKCLEKRKQILERQVEILNERINTQHQDIMPHVLERIRDYENYILSGNITYKNISKLHQMTRDYLQIK
jgi:hypothetical protein